MFGGKVMVQYTGDLDKKAEQLLAQKLESFSSNNGSGKFIPLPLGMTATMLDMKLTDAQFFELNKYSASQIAAAFGIKPNILNNYDKSSYSNSETQQLDFYINSLLPILKSYKEENTRKLLTTSELQKSNMLEHDIRELFKLDPVKQIDRLQKGINNFMFTPNEAREELGQPYNDDPVANRLIGNGNYIRLDQVGTQWRKGRDHDKSDTGNT
jgi:HK97 family phage portal protein